MSNIQAYNKAIIAAVFAAASAALPAVQDALNEWAAGAITTIVTTVAVFLARNKPAAG